MDPSKPSKSRKPSLPRLTTNVPAARRSSTSLKNIDPNPQQPPRGPAVFVDDNKDVENIGPFLRYAADVKPPVVRQNLEQPPMTKTKVSYYEDAFNYRGVHNSPQDRVAQEAIIVADLKTNYKNKDGSHQFINDFLFRLAHIYQRSETSIMITYHEDTRIVYGNTSGLRSYSLIIYALPSLIAPVTNERSTTLIQNALQDLLGIPSALGVVIYIPVPEENFATNGSTFRGEISRMERNERERNSEDSPGLFKTLSCGVNRRFKSNSGQSAPPSASGVTSPADNPKSPLKSPDITKPTDSGTGEGRGQGVRKRDSLRALVPRRLFDKIREKDGKEKNDKEVTTEKDIRNDTKEISKEVPKEALEEEPVKEDTKETNVKETDD